MTAAVVVVVVVVVVVAVLSSGAAAATAAAPLLGTCAPACSGTSADECPALSFPVVLVLRDRVPVGDVERAVRQAVGCEGHRWRFVNSSSMGALPSTDVAVIAVESPDSAVLAIARRSGLFRSVNPQRTFRTLLSTGDSPPAKQSDIPERKPAAGALGDNVRVAVLDSGLNAGGGGLANIVERLDFTSDGNPDDVLGHGTFVASAVAGRHPGCEGQAPNALMHIMRVFTADQTSYTSWFLDAFNYAIWAGIDVLNLSVGGPDHVDTPFIDKILEMCAAGIVVVSAVGNDGPLWGTLLSPADLPCVIGVGGLDAEGRIASFSSRGMTTMDLHEGGYGRVKPDVVTLAQNLRGSGRSGTCQTLSGTSVASPVVAGIVARMLSALAPDSPLRNPGAIKQALVQTAEIVPDATMFEQGAGRLNGDAAVAFLAGGSMVPHVSVLPNRLDLTDCPYFWPFCTQPLFAAAEPVVFNFTVHSSVAVDGYIVAPRFVYTNGSLPVLDLSFVHCDVIWPWTGWFAVLITVVRDVSQRVDVAGTIYFDVDSDHRSCNVEIPFRASVIPRPPRRRRILWDQFHNLQYPRVFAPRDNLQEKSDTLDWHGDHLHTNFRGFYSELRAAGFFVDIAMRDLTCVDTSRYGALVIVDAEEEFFHEEIVRVYDAVVNGGLSLVVIGDWFNHGEMQRARFFDQNTQHWWGPITGGSNIPALNDLLDPFGISFSDDVVEGRFHIGGRPVAYPSGTTVSRFPSGGRLLPAQELKSTQGRSGMPMIGGVLSVNSSHVIVYGDSSGIDDVQSVLSTRADWLIILMLEAATSNIIPDRLSTALHPALDDDYSDAYPAPVRLENSFDEYALYSRVYGRAPSCSVPTPTGSPETHARLRIRRLRDWRFSVSASGEPFVVFSTLLYPVVIVVVTLTCLITVAMRRTCRFQRRALLAPLLPLNIPAHHD